MNQKLKFAQYKNNENDNSIYMRKVSIIVSILGLLCTVVPSFFVLYGKLSWDHHALLMAIGMVLWFVSAPFWMKTKSIQ